MDDNEDIRTIWCGNLSEKVSQDILYELFHQAGPLDRVRIPRDGEGRQRNFGFVTYVHKESVPYAINLFQGTALFDRKLKMNVQKGADDPILNRNCDPSPNVAMLLGRTLDNCDPQIEEKFINMTNQNLINGLPSYNPNGGPSADFGSYDQHQLTNKLTTASLQGQWSSRHNPENDRFARRHEPYRDRWRGDRNEDSRRHRSRERSDRRGGEGRRDPSADDRDVRIGVGETRGNDRFVELRTNRDNRSLLERFEREYSDGRSRHRGGNFHNGNRRKNYTNHSRD